MADHLSKAGFTAKVSSWPMLLIRYIWVKSLKWSTITWASQMRALVSLSENCGNNPGWSNYSWSNETPYPILVSVSFLVDHYFFPSFLYFLLLDVPNMHDAHRVTSSFKSINIDGRNPSISSLNMDMGWRWDNLSCQYFNFYCKGYRTYVNMMFSFFLWYSLIRIYSPLRKF